MEENNLNILPIQQPDPIAPENLPPSPPMPVSKPNSNSVLIILSLFLIILVGVVAFLGYQNFQLQNKVTLLTMATPISSPVPTATPDPTAGWLAYSIAPDSKATGFESYNIKLPASFKQITHVSNFQGTETFQDSQNGYKLTIEEQKNLNTQTKKPFSNLQELTGLSYASDTITVDGTPSAKVLPRAGSETIYKVLFFSKDLKLTYGITLETPIDGSKVEVGGVLFNQILSTFKFTQ